MNEPIGPLGFTRPAHARMCGTGGGNVRLADGTLQYVTRGQLSHLLAAQQAPDPVRWALAKVRAGLPLSAAERDACRSYLAAAVADHHAQ
jgi:hypothetical protein